MIEMLLIIYNLCVTFGSSFFTLSYLENISYDDALLKDNLVILNTGLGLTLSTNII